MKEIQNKILIFIFVTVAFYAIFLMVTDFSLIVEKIQKFDFQFVPLILALMILGWFCLFFKWDLLLKTQNIIIPKKRNIPIYFCSFALSLIPGKLGELIKSQLLKKNFDVPIKSTAPLVFIEQIYTILGLVIISLMGIWLFDIGLYIITIFSIILVFVFCVIRSKKLFEKFQSILNKRKFLQKYIESFSISYEVLKKSTQKKIFLFATGLSMLFWLTECVIAYLVLLSFGIELELLLIIPIYLSSILLGVVSFLPLGIGVVESSLTGFLTLHGIDISTALAAVIVIRIFTKWIAVSFGFIVLKFSNGFNSKK